MKPYWSDNHRTLYNKDCRDMSELPDNSIQCVITSPPYWGLRKYSGQQDLIWGGDNHHEHEWTVYKRPPGGGHPTESAQVGAAQSDVQRIYNYQAGYCSVCGAWRGAYGLEPTPELYVQHTIEILREIRRVLRPDGVVFWNIGDSYAGSGRGLNADGKDGGSGEKQLTNAGSINVVSSKRIPRGSGRWGGGNLPSGDILKPKDLCLIPFRIALAAQADGWWVRSDIIWSKNNPMPESVRDRPTNSHEYIFMFTKSSRYYWDAEAVREPHSEISIARAEYENHRQSNNGSKSAEYPMPANIVKLNPAGRNLRSVWTFPTQPYPGAHFATFPEALPERCIKAATPEAGCCAECGKPWERIIERTGHINKREPAHASNNCPTKTDSTGWAPLTAATNAWQPSCKCNTDKPPVPSIVLDPFAGTGTTLKVAAELNRRAVGYEISEEYCQLIVNRNRQGVIV